MYKISTFGKVSTRWNKRVEIEFYPELMWRFSCHNVRDHPLVTNTWNTLIEFMSNEFYIKGFQSDDYIGRRMVAPQDIYHDQSSIDMARLVFILKAILKSEYHTKSVPDVLKISDEFYIVGNGNHRVTSHRMLNKGILCDVYYNERVSKLFEVFLL